MVRTPWNAVRAVTWTLWGLVLVIIVWSLFLELHVESVALLLFWLALPVGFWFWQRVFTILDRYGR